ncbi:hypothetical protein OCU04_006115 [Sclerotinia nivalis]|uniref:Uncharacterized protein n=1 Tax=Sclerotinia nivalis TaxID=352851 RepID=A0A9X0AMB7_9HELO|nr:hypothetical protein OCU04_006115 [Sclerotinia nivalis]
MAVGAPAHGLHDVALQRRQKLMGPSGPAALIKNLRVFSIVLFACIGGLLYVRDSMHVFISKESSCKTNL